MNSSEIKTLDKEKIVATYGRYDLMAGRWARLRLTLCVG